MRWTAFSGFIAISFTLSSYSLFKLSSSAAPLQRVNQIIENYPSTSASCRKAPNLVFICTFSLELKHLLHYYILEVMYVLWIFECSFCCCCCCFFNSEKFHELVKWNSCKAFSHCYKTYFYYLI